MNKLFTLFTLVLCLTIGISFSAFAQDTTDVDTEGTETTTEEEGASEEETTEEAEAEEPVSEGDVAEITEESKPMRQFIKEKFIEGGWEFMSAVLVCLILGLAIAFERIIILSLATSNTTKLTSKVKDALASGGVEAAKDVVKNTRGPVASIFMQGLMRVSEGLEMVEKSVIAYGSVEAAKLEKGITYIALFIAIAPMLGFMGTVLGMIDAFDKIEAMGDIQISAIAGSIKIALITTVSGLIVAIILQVFYNYILSRVDAILSQMEEASISLVDVLVENNIGTDK